MAGTNVTAKVKRRTGAKPPNPRDIFGAPVKKTPPKSSGGGGGTPKPVPSAPPQAYDPLAPSYKTPQEFENAVESGAQAQIQPALDEVEWERQQAQNASATRQHELQGWYGWAGQQLGSSFDKTSAAANNLIAAQSAGTKEEQDALAAALHGTSADRSALATQLGGAPPPSQDDQLLAAALAQGSAANQGVAGGLGAFVGGAGERQQTAAIGGLESSRTETGRLQAIMDQLTGQRRDVMARLPDLLTQERQTLGQQEQSKAESNRQYRLAVKQFGEAHANRLFQQWLASQQLGLSKKTENFQEWLAKQNLVLDTEKQGHQEQIDWANLSLNKEQVEGQLAAISQKARDAKGADAKKKAELRAKQWQNGLSLLSGFLAPSSGEGAPHQRLFYQQGDIGKTAADGTTIGAGDVGQPIRGADGKPIHKETSEYQPRSYGRAYDILTSQAGMSRSDALRLLRHSDDVDWRRAASADLARLKRRKKGPVDVAPGPGKHGAKHPRPT